MTTRVVSVCIATCNQSRFIRQCVCSVLDQQVDGVDLRIIVGDDASDDGTSDIVAGLAADHRGIVTHLRHPRRIGAFANMRELITRADGDFVARVDGDDYWLPGKLQRQLDYLECFPDCAAVYTNAVTVDVDGRRIGLFNDVGDARFDLEGLLQRGNFLNNSSVLFRSAGRKAWLDVDQPQVDYRVHLWHARHGWLGHIGEALTAYRVNAPGSAVASMNDRVRELYWEAIQSVPRGQVSDAAYTRALADFLRRVFFRAVRTGNWPLFSRWRARVHAASPLGAIRTDTLVAISIARIAGKQARGQFRRTADGHRLRISYRR
jgi:glycosyltransferase involved in cell wall biosynthesis